jgi:hypothetical protein
MENNRFTLRPHSSYGIAISLTRKQNCWKIRLYQAINFIIETTHATVIFVDLFGSSVVCNLKQIARIENYQVRINAAFKTTDRNLID